MSYAQDNRDAAWYAAPLMVTGHQFMGSSLGPAAGLSFGASSDGRQTYQFKNRVKLELESKGTPVVQGAGIVSKKDFEFLLRTLCGHMEAGGPGHAWGERMLLVMAPRFRVMVMRWARMVADDPKRYATRLQNMAIMLSDTDLAAQDSNGGSLLQLLTQSEAQFLQENHWLLAPRDARAPQVPGPMPPFMLQYYMRQHGGRARAATRRTAGQTPAGSARAGQESGQSSRAVAGEIESATDDSDSEAADVLTHLLPLEQVDARKLPYDQITRQQGRPQFAPPPRNPAGWPTPEEQEELQELHPDWSYRLPARMPDMMVAPAFSDQDADTAAALQALEDEVLSATGFESDQCPKPAKYIMAGFEGQFMHLNAQEHEMLENPQPLAQEDPLMLCSRMQALIQIKGGESEWPRSLTNSKYMDAINSYEGGIGHAVSNYMISNKIKLPHADVRELASAAKAAWDEYIRRNRRPPKLKQPKQPALGGSQGREQRGAADRQGSSGGRQAGGGDRGGSGGYRREQGGGYNRGGGNDYRKANTAEVMWEEPGYSAHAAQQMAVPPTTYNAAPPPTRHYAQYGGGGSRGSYGGQRERCVTCGISHGDVCYVEQPHRAPNWWEGPRAVPVYEAYVLNCKEHKMQPARFSGQLPRGRGFRKEVADYLAQVGDRQPTGAPGGGARAGTQHQGGGAGASGRGGRAHGTAGFMAETAGPDYPDLSETFTRGTRMHDEEGQDDADEAYYGCYAESETSEVQEALVSTRSSGSKLTAAAQAAVGSSQPRGAPTEVQQAAGSSPSGSAQPPAAAAQQGRPPLPPPVASRRPPGQALGQPVADSTVAPAVAVRSRPPLPFTTVQPAEGTPPSLFPAPVPRHKGSTVQQAVARGGVMQQLPVSFSLLDLASNANVSADALKRLLSSGATKLAIMQRSAAQEQMGASHVVVNFSSIAEAMQLLAPTQAYAALDLGGDQVQKGHANTVAATTPTEEPGEAKEAAGDAATAVMEAAPDAAKAGEGVAASTACAAAGRKAARLQELVVPSTVIKRPTTFELLAQTPDTLGITVALLDSNTGQPVRVISGLIRRFILDSGADVVLMSEDCAKRNKLQLVPSNRRICTSSGQVTRTLSKVNQPVQYVLGKGTPAECAIVEDTFVMPGSGSTYDILLGTPLIVKWGLYVDPLTSRATYRPFWHSKGDSRTEAQVPVLTATDGLASPGAAKASELVPAVPEHDAEPLQPELHTECERAEAQAPAELLLQPVQSAAVKQMPAVADAAAALTQARQPEAQTSVQSSYQPPTSFLIVTP